MFGDGPLPVPRSLVDVYAVAGVVFEHGLARHVPGVSRRRDSHRTALGRSGPEVVQVGRAVAIARLRQADVSLEDMGQLLGGNDDAVAVLLRHRRRLEDRISSTQQMVDLVDQLIREERSNMPATIQLMEVILRVEDVEATVEFYRDVFGMDFQPDDHNGTLPRHYDACGGSWEPEVVVAPQTRDRQPGEPGEGSYGDRLGFPCPARHASQLGVSPSARVKLFAIAGIGPGRPVPRDGLSIGGIPRPGVGASCGCGAPGGIRGQYGSDRRGPLVRR